MAIAAHPLIKAWPENDRMTYKVKPIREALEATYKTDAHLVSYVVENADLQPRIKKINVSDYPGGTIYHHVLAADVDHVPHKVPWDDARHEAFRQIWSDPPEILQKAGVYFTRSGWRIVQPLARPILTETIEPYIADWLLALDAALKPWSNHFEVDFACKDWTRLMRLPNVMRRDKTGFQSRYKTEFIDLGRMGTYDPPEPSFEVVEREKVKKERVIRPRAVGEFDPNLPPAWEHRIKRIVEETSLWTDSRHMIYLGISGYLLKRGVAPEAVPAIVSSIAYETWSDTNIADRVKAARSTVERWARGEPISSWVPDPIAHAIEDALALSTPMQESTSAQEGVDLVSIFREVDERVTIVAAECGGGKTAAAIRLALERAAKGGRTQVKTAISVDKTSLAIQVVNDLRESGAESVGGVKRLFGPLSVKNADGRPACIYHDNAALIVAGGLSLQREFCKGRDKAPCPVFQDCTARLAYEGEDDARIIVAPHAMIDVLAAEIGGTGLLIIDEPPAGIETMNVELAEIELLERNAPWLSKPWQFLADVMIRFLRPVMEGAIEYDAARERLSSIDGRKLLYLTGLESGEQDDGTPRDMIRAAAEELGSLVDVRDEISAFARTHAPTAQTLGAIAATAKKLQRAAKGGNLARVGYAPEALSFALPNESLQKALKRPSGSTIMADAGGKVHVPVARALAGYEPKFIEAPMPDGAPIERTLFRTRAATRSRWLSHDADRSTLYSASARIVEWAAGRPLGVITFKALLSDSNFLRIWPKGTILHYYGATRGMNNFKHLDCLATLGDPRPNIGAIEMEADILDVSPEERVIDMARAELEQAHGRLRVVHRDRPGFACHVGALYPGGWGWTPDRVGVISIT